MIKADSSLVKYRHRLIEILINEIVQNVLF